MASLMEFRYIRKATVKQDGADGLLYAQIWATGWQLVILKNHPMRNE